jgi:hypothetical protein
MSDNLRDRIAAVLYGNLRRQQRIDRPDRFLDWIDTSELADAVIAELGLEREYVHHVTDWMSLTDDTTGDVNHD